MGQETSYITRNRAAGALSNELGISLPEFLGKWAMPAIKSAAQSAYARRRAELGYWLKLGEPGPRRVVAGGLDAPPPLLVGEDAALPELSEFPDTSTGAIGIAGAHVNFSDQRASVLSLDEFAALGAAAGDLLATAAEENAIEELETASFTAAQISATALSAANLQAGLQKLAALRTPAGGFGPGAGVLLCAADLAPVVGSVWPNGLPMTIVYNRLMTPGRWFLLPRPEFGVLRFDVSSTVISRELNTTPVAESGLAFTSAMSTAPLFLTAADGSPRWCIKGGT